MYMCKQQVNFEAQREHDCIPNYKQLQLALTASGATQVCPALDGHLPVSQCYTLSACSAEAPASPYLFWHAGV